ncbi:MAG: sulfite exporter TauE/SafE family protein [bacterium]
MLHFPISGVETYWWLPMVVAFFVSMLMSPGGLSGAFLLLPFQVSILGFAGPAVTPTNLIFNIIAIPSGVYHYWREKRMVWPLAWANVIGTLPGVFIGAYVRIHLLPDPRSFKLFAGLVLLYISFRLVKDILKPKPKSPPTTTTSSQFQVSEMTFSLKSLAYTYEGERFQTPTWGVMLLCFIVGIIGGIYGIGGGAIIAPFLVTFFRLPVHSIAGASLFGTVVSSVVGVGFYALIAPVYAGTGLTVAPDWLLGTMFGVGGALGMYTGARLQRYIPALLIKILIAAALLFISLSYILQFFLKG